MTTRVCALQAVAGLGPRRPRRSYRVRALQAVAGLAVTLLAGLTVSGCSKSEADNPMPKTVAPLPIAVKAIAAEARVLPGALDVTGTLNADAHTDVAAETAGRAVRVNVERGQVVEAGAVLAQLDQQDALNQLHEAEAVEAQTMAKLGLAPEQPFDAMQTSEVRQARVTAERMEVEHQRYERLIAQGLVSRSEYDLKRNDHLAQKEQLAAKLNEARQVYQTLQAQRARVAMAHKTLADTTIRAPYSGLIAEKHIDVGHYVQKGARVATLVRVDPLRIELAVPEAAVASVKRGQKVAFWVQTYPGRTFQGSIAYVGPALKADARTLVVEALVPNGSGALQPGLFATARIELPAGAPTPFVPATAVQTEAGVSRVFVIDNEHAEQRFVQLGRELNGHVEIVRGLKIGERVATSALESLADGSAVREQGGR